MNTYLNFSFYPIYEIYKTNKILLFKKLNSKIFKQIPLYIKHRLDAYSFLFENNYQIKFIKKTKKNLKYKNKLPFSNFFNIFGKNFIIFFFFNNLNSNVSSFFLNTIKLNLNLKPKSIYFLDVYKRTLGESFFYLRGLFLIFFIDASLTDDEPLWEPIEWSLVQTWILFIFIFAWIAENLITSRYGSYTGRDKRVWFAWYKTFWLIELCYIVSYGLAAVFVIVPFYYELTYSVSFIFSWWNWYTRTFFFKFISLYTIIIFIAYLIQLNIRWMNWKKIMFFVIIINIFLAYLLYTHFIMSFFGYFTDPLWYQKTRFVDYIQLSHEPLKWGWGPAKRDHFTYHKVSTVFWFKNDGPFAGAFLMFHLFFFLCLFFLYLYWLVLLRRIYTTKEVTYTLTTFCISSLKQFYYFFLLLYLLVFMSYIVCYWRFPIEFLWILNTNSWVFNFALILKDYFAFLINIF